MQWGAASTPTDRQEVAQSPPEPDFLEPDFSAARSCLCTEQASYVSLGGWQLLTLPLEMMP